MPAPDKIKQLVETFEQNLNEYHTHKNETELRRQFLDPFFETLGWDVSNTKGRDDRRKEVVYEKESTDGAIDRLVYELYGLTEDEVKVVEE